MASKRNRQRKLERVRVQRRIVRRSERARRRRQIQAGVGAGLVLVLIVLGVVWLVGGFSSKPSEPDNVARGTCSWTLKDLTTDLTAVDVGHPPTTGERRSGTETMTIKTNMGEIKVQLDLAKAPCTAVSFGFLGQKGFFSGSTCHRLNTELYTLNCGDPRSDGSGSPSYQFADEDLPTQPLASGTASPTATPTGPANYYPKGTIVMVNTGANTNGSQFMIIYKDGSTLSPAYSVVGRITSGLSIVEKVAKAGVNAGAGQSPTEGKPKTDLTIESLYLGALPAPTASPTASTPPVSPTTSPGT